MIMAKHRCEACSVALTGRDRNNVTTVLVDEAEQTWEVDVVIVSLCWFCDKCRVAISKKAVSQIPIEP